MPNLEIEKSLRQAVLKVQDEVSFAHACSLIQNPDININSAGPESGKSALVFIVEKLFVSLMAKNVRPDKTLIELRLRIIDKILAFNADPKTLQHPAIKELMLHVKKRAAAIQNNIQAKIRSLTSPSEFQLANFLDNVNADDKLFISAFHFYEEMIEVAKSIEIVEAKHDLDIQSGKFATVTNKAMLVLECHDDRGAHMLLTKLKSRLIEAGYATLCLELPSDSINYLQKYKQFLARSPVLDLVNQQEFIQQLIFIDPRHDYAGVNVIKLIMDVFASNFFESPMMMSLRDKGMFLNICQAAVKYDGKIMVVMGAAHNDVINNLNMLRIPNTVIAPFTDPENMCLREEENGNFVSKLPPDHKMSLLFSKSLARPLHFVDSKTREIEETLTSFARLNLGGPS